MKQSAKDRTIAEYPDSGSTSDLLMSGNYFYQDTRELENKDTVLTSSPPERVEG